MMMRRTVMALALLAAVVGGCEPPPKEEKVDRVGELIDDLTGPDEQARAEAMRELERIGRDARGALVWTIRTTDRADVRSNGLSLLMESGGDHHRRRVIISALLENEPSLLELARSLEAGRRDPNEAYMRPVSHRPPLPAHFETLAEYVLNREDPMPDDVSPRAIALKDKGCRLVYLGKPESTRIYRLIEDQRSEGGKLIPRAPTSDQYYQALKDQRAEGVELIQQALAIDARMPEAYDVLLTYYSFDLQDHDAAVVWLKKGVEVFPELVEMHLELARTCFRAEQYAEAAVAYERLIAMGQDNARVRRKLADAYAHDGKFTAAIAGYRVILNSDPNDAVAHENLIYALYKTNDRVGALREAQVYRERHTTDDQAAWARQAIRTLSK